MEKKNLECLYRKVGRRYVPTSVCCEPSSISDGIWYVRHKKGSTGVKSAEYVGSLLKVGDAEDISLSTQNGLSNIADDILESSELSELTRNGFSVNDIVYLVVRKCFDVSDNKNKQRQ